LAHQHGLYADVFETVADLDEELNRLATVLAKSSPEAMAELKKIFWQGTENWDQLLSDRAGISGTLVLSDFTVQAINAFKGK
jgi:methylglutaconyl-CoA hydratase